MSAFSWFQLCPFWNGDLNKQFPPHTKYLSVFEIILFFGWTNGSDLIWRSSKLNILLIWAWTFFQPWTILIRALLPETGNFPVWASCYARLSFVSPFPQLRLNLILVSFGPHIFSDAHNISLWPKPKIIFNLIFTLISVRFNFTWDSSHFPFESGPLCNLTWTSW
jgi:hypothetical protein